MSVYGNNAYKGVWKPRNPHKYVGDVNNITYRSSWELKFFNYCDISPSVIEWASEEVVIPYFDPVKQKTRRYFVDFWAVIKTNQGVKKFLIEIKPSKFTKPPEVPKRKTKRYVEEQLQYINNDAKWKAASALCESNGINFMILTEKELFGKQPVPKDGK